MEPSSRTTTMQFPACLDQIGALRRWAVKALPELGLHLDDPLVDDVKLVLSEFGANAIVHTGGERTDVALTAILAYLPGGVLRIALTDPGLGRPEQRQADEDATSGRGLQLSAGVTDRLGVDDLGAAGKTVWAELDLPPEAAAGPARPAVVTGEAVALRIAILRADDAVRALRPNPGVGTLPERRPALHRHRIPAA
ncbi:ATP-binding protein [Kitasatospora sp. NPDC096128]|uniref:ATP-binding protein n=1 Tax=Kitasatospora sp. NPDC096128 TaxID=3155547 RepID=UPI0033304B67